MENSITVKDVIMQVIKELGEIRIPMNLVKEIGFPIGRSIDNLQACINAWEQAEEQAPVPAPEGEPETAEREA